MEHPAELNSDVELAIRQERTIPVRVISYEFDEVDTAYHYHLQGELSDGNNAATVQFGDVHQSLVKLKEE